MTVTRTWREPQKLSHKPQQNRSPSAEAWYPSRIQSFWKHHRSLPWKHWTGVFSWSQGNHLAHFCREKFKQEITWWDRWPMEVDTNASEYLGVIWFSDFDLKFHTGAFFLVNSPPRKQWPSTDASKNCGQILFNSSNSHRNTVRISTNNLLKHAALANISLGRKYTYAVWCHL